MFVRNIHKNKELDSLKFGGKVILENVVVARVRLAEGYASGNNYIPNSTNSCKYVGIEELGNGIWKVFYRTVFLGFFNENELRNKEKSIRLETNLV